ncbi:hypothetical protein B4098_1648 [Heyndrickxia coagulans]|uniref:Uncharacterized protein n=1 Tax=Heyndrickxia coagulans TaxID=1398 RepID=A0A150K7L1_HEYCO|nr:hypothetical protein B4098_1648 [Heyndrickxia coagulans]
MQTCSSPFCLYFNHSSFHLAIGFVKLFSCPRLQNFSGVLYWH